MIPEDASVFDSKAEHSFIERRLPHWGQPGAFAFITFRLKDSLPAALVKEFTNHRSRLLAEAGLCPTPGNLADEINRLPRRQAALLRWKLFTAWDARLDETRGECYLRRPCISKIVADSLLKFDRDRYITAAFVVMPNHVHVLAAFAEQEMITEQGAGWRRFMARAINPQIGHSGHLWQEDQFDHLIRNESSFDRIRRYIIDNPSKARLFSGEYRLYVSPDW